MGKKSSPKPTPAPDPVATAAAQTGMNINTAVANSYMQNANETSPTGSVSYTTGAMQTITDPNTGQSYQVPTFNRDVKLSEGQQGIFNTNEQLQQQLSNIGLNQANRVGDILGTPVNFNNAQQVSMPDIQTKLGPADYETARKDVEQATMSRANPMLNNAKLALDSKLVAEGHQRGTPAYNEAMNEWGQQYNDATMQAILAGGQEQSRLFGMDLQRAGFQNQAAQQQFANQGAKRATDIQESMLLRQTPLNEINSLMAGSQISMPQFSAYNSGQVANTDYGGYVYKGADINAQNWRQQTAADAQGDAAMWGALGSLGGGLLSRSERHVKRDIELIGEHPSGLPWYRFNYIWDGPDEPPREGVMFDEVMVMKPEAAHWIDGAGYVDYGRL